MSLFEFFSTAFQIAVETVRYLFAYAMVPVPALAGAILLRWTLERKKLSQSLSQAGFGRVFLVAIGQAPAQKEILQALRQLADKPALSILYLICSHNLVLYYFFLIGPLLGKDALLSHLIGTGFFLVISILLLRFFRFSAVFQKKRVESIKRPLLREASCFAVWTLYGLLWGSLFGAWGLTSHSFAPAEIGTNPAVAQFSNAFLGGALAIMTNMWPVAALFAGTYLWKIGLAHAGLVAFFLTTTVTPQTWVIYRRAYGNVQAFRLCSLLFIAVLIAGLLTALLYGLTDLDIRYRLIPEQLW